MIKFALILGLAGSFIGCTTTGVETEQITLSNGTRITSTAVGELPVKKMRWLHISGQPSQEDLQALQQEGFEAVIDLRLPGEREWDEKAVVTGLGMEYRQVPFVNRDTKVFYTSGMKELTDVYKEFHGRKVLFHCGSGNRAAAWLTAYLVMQNNQSIADAMVVGEGMGLESEVLKENLVNFVNTTSLSEE